MASTDGAILGASNTFTLRRTVHVFDVEESRVGETRRVGVVIHKDGEGNELGGYVSRFPQFRILAKYLTESYYFEIWTKIVR